MTDTMTYGQKESSLQAAIVGALPADDADGDHYVYVLDFSDTYVVYCVGWDEYLQDDYSMDADGNVKLAGDPKPVKSVTTYVPVETESVGVVNVERRAVGQRLATYRTGVKASPSVATIRKTDALEGVQSEPLTYHEHSRNSYYADLLLRHKYPQAETRLARHAVEMETIRKEYERNAWKAIRAGGIEYRVDPGTLDGSGGYFAPPLWVNQLFATAVRPGRVLAGLIPRFDLPPGVSSINLPILGVGTRTQHDVDNQSVPSADITDTAGSSNVVTIAGQADVSLQMLEQSPAGAHLDWVITMDLREDYDRDLETELLHGSGSAVGALLGIVNAGTSVTWNSGSPTGSLLWTQVGELAAQLADNRDLPPEVWLMRTARWCWMQTAEDLQGRPFGISTPFFLGSDDETPDPAGGLISWPVFLDDAIKPTLGAANNQDIVICLRPTDLVLLEGQPRTSVMTEVLSGTLGVRIQMHAPVAAITNRYTTGSYVLTGTGMVVQSSF